MSETDSNELTADRAIAELRAEADKAERHAEILSAVADCYRRTAELLETLKRAS